MRKLQIENAEGMRLAIQQGIGRSDESRYDHRLRGVLLVANGHSCGKAARLFAEDARTIQRWVSPVAHYNTLQKMNFIGIS